VAVGPAGDGSVGGALRPGERIGTGGEWTGECAPSCEGENGETGKKAEGFHADSILVGPEIDFFRSD
jgi:hypothetical protein